MPRAKLSKSLIDALPTPSRELVYWDERLPGFGVKVTPAGRKVFVVLYRTGGGASRLRKYTIGPHGRVTLHLARNEAQRVLGARREGRDPAAEKADARRKLTTDRLEDVVEAFIKQHVSKRRSGPEIERLLRRELVERWGARSIHTITKREVVRLLGEVVDRGTPIAANRFSRSPEHSSTGASARPFSIVRPAKAYRRPAAKRREIASCRTMSWRASSLPLAKSPDRTVGSSRFSP